MTEMTITTAQKIHVGAKADPAGSNLPGPISCVLNSNAGDAQFVLDADGSGGYIVSADVEGVSTFQLSFTSGSLNLVEDITCTVLNTGTGDATALVIDVRAAESK